MFSRIFKYHLFEIFIFGFLLFFSFWLMFATFSYKDGSMLIASKAWSDFAQHIPLIRTFSFGKNFPPQEALFAGQAIHYHFLFYMFVGFLEKFGIRIDYALNIPSALGFFALLIMLYTFGKKVFKSTAVGLLTILFFICNGSLSFLQFFTIHPLSKTTLQTIITNTTFPSFGPYTNTIVSAFWNLNIYTNQRHLAAAYAFGLFVIYVLIFKCYRDASIKTVNEQSNTSFLKIIKDNFMKRYKATNKILSFTLGILLGFSFFFHLAVFLMVVVIVCVIFLLFKNLRIATVIILAVAGIMALPQYHYLRSSPGGFGIEFVPGYLVSGNLTIMGFLTYWFYNLGLHMILIPIGFILAPKNAKKLFVAFFALFLIGNLFQFSPEMAGNHKFFNFFLLFGSMLSAYTLVITWRKFIYLRPLVILATFLLILSGIIDFFPIYNDGKLILADYPITPDIAWIMDNTKPDSVFLNTNFLYDTASLAGRKIFMGWPYFAWSEGFDTNTRGHQMGAILGATDKATACELLRHYDLDYIELNPTVVDSNIPHISQLFNQQFKPIYQNPKTSYRIYSVAQNCTTL